MLGSDQKRKKDEQWEEAAIFFDSQIDRMVREAELKLLRALLTIIQNEIHSREFSEQDALREGL